MKNKLLNVVVILALLLIVSVGLNVVQHRNAKEENLKRLLDNGRAQVEISKHTAAAESYRDSARLERAKRIHGDSLAKSRENGLKMRVATYAKSLQLARVPVQPLIDSLQDLGLFVETYDSLSTAKDSLISHQSMRIDTLQQSFGNEIRQLEHASAEDRQAATLWEGQAKNFEALFRQADKKARRKFSVGPYAGYGVSREGLSPSVGVSVQWKLLSF